MRLLLQFAIACVTLGVCSPADTLDKAQVCEQSRGYLYSSCADFCIKIHRDRKTWVSAKAICEKEGGILVKVDTPAKRELVNFIAKTSGHDHYLGATDSGQDGVWRWLADNTTIPDFSMHGSKQCLEIRDEYLNFDDSDCNDARQKYICEIQLP